MGGSDQATATETLRIAIDDARRRSDTLEITLVCNGRGTRPTDGDFTAHSLASEFYSDQELSEVIGGLRRHGLLVAGVVNEQEFIVLSPPDFADGPTRVLMNFGSSRRGPWGKTLVPALAEARGWITTSSDAYAVALARHKYHAGLLLDATGISSPATWCYAANVGWIGGRRPADGSVVLVQPAYESASIGVDDGSKRVADGGLDAYCATVAVAYQQDVVVRQFISGYEIEVPVVHDERHRALAAVGIRIDGSAAIGDRFLTYERVLADDYGFFPAEEELGDAGGARLTRIAERAAEVMGLRGFCRIDFRVDASSGRAYVTDVSASPHFISHSSFAFAASRCGVEPAALPVALVGLALRRRASAQPSDQC